MIKNSLATFCSLIGIFTLTPAFSGSIEQTTTTVTRTHGVAEREIVRRQERVNLAEEAIKHGDEAMEEKDYEVATAQYKTAADLLGESDITHALRERALKGFCHASVQLAEQRIAEGRYADAEIIAKTVLDERYNPECQEALVLLANLEDPDHYNKTITPGFIGKVEQVKAWFIDAQGFYDSGRFDLAFKRYEQILNLDPYNIAARKGQEKVNLARSNAAISGYDETRSRAIWKVDRAWSNPVRRYTSGLPGDIINVEPMAEKGTEQISNKLNRIIFPRVNLKDATVRQAIDFLTQKAKELDVTEPDPAKRGLNIILRIDTASQPAAIRTTTSTEPTIPGLEAPPVEVTETIPVLSPNDSRITFTASNLPLREVLRYVADQASLKVKIEPYAVSLVPLSTPTDVILTREWKVPPGFISNQGSKPTESALTAPRAGAGGAREATNAGNQIVARAGAKEYLEAQGVAFPPGAIATYHVGSSRLVVRNTQENLDFIDTLVEAAGLEQPIQVDIEAKFVEISQNNLKELSFDWLLGQFNSPGSDRIYGSGGVSGQGRSISGADVPFSVPGTGVPVGLSPLTAGTRTGSFGIAANAIDSLLSPSGAGVAPGILGIAGVFTDPQFQVVIRALNQKKGVDLLSAPRVTTKSGQQAVIEIVREFRYPTEFDPPEIPQTIGAVGGGGGGGSTTIPVTPTTPTAFETRNTGVTLEVEPVVGPDRFTIDLRLAPQVVEFEGFINYGSPILSTTSSLGIAIPVVLTPNVINQPIFSLRKITTNVTVRDGSTVVLGGLMREDVQKVEDKVPILGDIPFVGRLFRSSIDQHLKRNLIIFVTARLINPDGDPIHEEEEKEEVVETITAGESPLVPAEMPLFQK